MIPTNKMTRSAIISELLEARNNGFANIKVGVEIPTHTLARKLEAVRAYYKAMDSALIPTTKDDN